MISSVIYLKLCKKKRKQEFIYLLMYLTQYLALNIFSKQITCNDEFYLSRIFAAYTSGQINFFFKINFDSENKWKTVSVAEAYTTTLSHDFRKTRRLLKKCSAMNLENHWTKNFCLKFLCLGFILFQHFSIFLLF